MWLLHPRALVGPPGDRYTGFMLWQVLIPFASSTCRPLWADLGQLALYLSILVTVTFCLRRWIGSRTWRAIIVLSLVASALALAHGIWSGTDSAAGWVRALYSGSGASLAVLPLYRVGAARRRPAPRPRRSWRPGRARGRAAARPAHVLI